MVHNNPNISSNKENMSIPTRMASVLPVKQVMLQSDKSGVGAVCEERTWSGAATADHAALITDSPGEEKRGLAWTSVGTGHSKAQCGYDFGQKFLATQHVKQLLSYVDRVPGGEIQGTPPSMERLEINGKSGLMHVFVIKAPKQRGHRILSFREQSSQPCSSPSRTGLRKGIL